MKDSTEAAKDSTSTWPHGAERYLVRTDASTCTGWRGAKFYGRPVWTLWMQRLVWERAYGALPSKSRVSETCETRGCLTLEHLHMTARAVRVPKTICRTCGGVLSRDVRDKTYCQACLRTKSREYRKRKKEAQDVE